MSRPSTDEDRQLMELLKKVRLPQELLIKKTVYSHTESVTKDSGETRIEEHYKIYSFMRTEAAITRYLVVQPDIELRTGNCSVCIRPLDAGGHLFQLLRSLVPDVKVVEEIAKDMRIPIWRSKKRRPKQEIWNDVMETGTTKQLFFEILPVIESAELAKLDTKHLGQLESVCLHLGWHIDHVIEYFFRAYLPRLKPADTYEMTESMKYQPHGFLFTNSKVAKSNLAEKVGRRIDRGSVARLLGFSTAKDTVEGSLNKETAAVLLDELQEEQNISLYGQLLNFLELGIALVEKGRAPVRTVGSCPVVFMGNPKPDTAAPALGTGADLAQKFYLALNVLTDNFEALSTRTGIILFGMKFETANRLEHDVDLDTRRASVLLKHLQDTASDLYTDFMRRNGVIAWLNHGHDKEYIEQIDTILEGGIEARIALFVRGQKESYRHARGACVRLAASDFLGHDPADVSDDELLECLEDHYGTITAHNIKSLRKLASSVDERAVGEVMAVRWQGIKNTYIKTMVQGLCLYVLENGPSIRVLSMETIKPYYERAANQQEKPQPFWKAHDYFKRRFNSVQNVLRVFGIRLILWEGKVLAIEIADDALVSELARHLDLSNLSKHTTDVSKEEKNKSADHTNLTNHTKGIIPDEKNPSKESSNEEKESPIHKPGENGEIGGGAGR